MMYNKREDAMNIIQIIDEEVRKKVIPILARFAPTAKVQYTVSNAGDYAQIIAHITADNYIHAESAARIVFKELSEGRAAYVRVPPEADSQYDFYTGQWLHKGYVRFGIKDEPGEMLYRHDDGTYICYIAARHDPRDISGTITGLPWIKETDSSET